MWQHKCNPTAMAWHHLLMGGELWFEILSMANLKSLEVTDEIH